MTPSPDSPNYVLFKRGSSAVLVDEETYEAAVKKAVSRLSEKGWDIKGAEKGRVITREIVQDDIEFLHLFDYATANGIASLINTWTV